MAISYVLYICMQLPKIINTIFYNYKIINIFAIYFIYVLNFFYNNILRTFHFLITSQLA